jgi:hypothetical protein
MNQHPVVLCNGGCKGKSLRLSRRVNKDVDYRTWYNFLSSTELPGGFSSWLSVSPFLSPLFIDVKWYWRYKSHSLYINRVLHSSMMYRSGCEVKNMLTLNYTVNNPLHLLTRTKIKLKILFLFSLCVCFFYVKGFEKKKQHQNELNFVRHGQN